MLTHPDRPFIESIARHQEVLRSRKYSRGARPEIVQREPAQRGSMRPGGFGPWRLNPRFG